jgi:hypothetical protein
VTSPGKAIDYASMLTDLKSSLNHALSPHHPAENGAILFPNKLLMLELSTKSLVFQSPSVKRAPGDTNTKSSFFNGCTFPHHLDDKLGLISGIL